MTDTKETHPKNDLDRLETLMDRVGSKAVAAAIEDFWGERCKDFEPMCQTCLAWRWYDEREATP